MYKPLERRAWILGLLACVAVAPGVGQSQKAEGYQQPSAIELEVIELLVDWAIHGQTLPGSSHLQGLPFPDAECVRGHLSDGPLEFVYVSVGGVHRPYPKPTAPTYKYFLKTRRLAPMDPVGEQQFDQDMRAGNYTPRRWLLLAVSEPSDDGSIHVTFRYGHAAGSLVFSYSNRRLEVDKKSSICLELDEPAPHEQ
jgi:hypothetical protein